MSGRDDNPLGLPSRPPAPEPHEEPPADARGRHEGWVADHDTGTRDAKPALGTPGQPAPWRPADEAAHVTLANPEWADAGWSFLFGHDTDYAEADARDADVAAANRRMRRESTPDDMHGPFIKPHVWTWEIAVYFWLGGIASGSAFAALAADLAGDEWSASVARKVALAAVAPAPLLLVTDLGRPARFLNMLRVLKPRSPMNTGAWCLAAFSTTGGAAVALDLLGRPRPARALGAATAMLGGYLGSYTGILLATTAIPVWARSRIFLGPLFVSTATATGAAATRLTLVATGRRPVGHPTRIALNRLEAAAMLTELVLSAVNERRLGRAGRVFSEGAAGRQFRAAKWLSAAGVALNLLGPRRTTVAGQHVASVLYLAAGLGFRFAWIEAGRASAKDDEAVALMARGTVTADERLRRGAERRSMSEQRRPRGRGPASKALRAWSRTIGRTSLVAERVLRRA
ncbi:MAG TPA: NrfD/PsrC family molybdoenzyme membrane anchor subunit [Asanoa sp.]